MAEFLCPNTNLLGRLRKVVSKKKRRYTEHGFNLDLNYVTPRLIAMGVPAQGFESVYRNPSSEVHRFLELRHTDHYKVYNLCTEYAPSKYFVSHQLERFPFHDHNPCALEMISLFCRNVQEYLDSDEDNIIAVHCKAGKGRTGMMLAATLLHLGICATADEALGKFADERTYNSSGVTIPSQIRYVHYYESVLQRKPSDPAHARQYRLTRVLLYSLPAFSRLNFNGGGCRTTFKLQRLEGNGRSWKMVDVYRYKGAVKDADRTPRAGEHLELVCSGPAPVVLGDVKLKLYALEASEKRKMCHMWFNTRFVANGMLHFSKREIDKACKDKHCKRFPESFAVRVYLDLCTFLDSDYLPDAALGTDSIQTLDSIPTMRGDDDTDSSGSGRDDCECADDSSASS